MNKKGYFSSKGISGLIYAIIFFIIIVIVLASGGAGTIISITKTISGIPPWLWIGIGFFVLLIIFRRKK